MSVCTFGEMLIEEVQFLILTGQTVHYNFFSRITYTASVLKVPGIFGTEKTNAAS